MTDRPITHLFLDIGGVLATNGWDRPLRQKTAEHFHLDIDETNERHHLTYDTYESGKMSLATYFGRLIFYEPRDFTLQDVLQFVLNEARPFPEVISLVSDLRAKYGLKIAVVSNEGRELATDRIRRFKLHDFVDFFVVSSFVHFRKPDEDLYRLALDVAQAEPHRVAYLEDRRMFVEVAQTLGINAIWHTSFESTREALERLGLKR